MAPGAVQLTLSVSGHDLNLAFKGSQSFATFPASSSTSFSSIKESLLSQTTGLKSPPAADLARSSFWVQIDETCDLLGLLKLLSVDLLNLSITVADPPATSTPACADTNGAGPGATAPLSSTPTSTPTPTVMTTTTTTTTTTTLVGDGLAIKTQKTKQSLLPATLVSSRLEPLSASVLLGVDATSRVNRGAGELASCSGSTPFFGTASERTPLNGQRRVVLPGVDDVKKALVQVPLPRSDVDDDLEQSVKPNKHQLQVLRWMWERYGAEASRLHDGPTVYEMIPQQDGTLREFYNDFIAMKERQWITEVETAPGVYRVGPAIQPFVEALGTSLSSLPCLHCSAQGWLGDKNPRLQEQYLEIVQNRPPPSKDYDQQFIVPANVLHRAAFMNARGDLAKRRVLIIGDDDLLSVVLGLSGLAEEVVVLDVDTRIVDFINRCSEDYGLKIKAYPFDIRFPFPREFYRRFDTFNCDPVETLEGIKLFLSAGAVGLKGAGSAIYFGLTTMEASLTKWHAIQDCILGMNFAITDVQRKFSEYATTDFDDGFTIQQKLGPNIRKFNWYRSSLLRLESFDVPLPCTDVDVTRPHLCEIYIDSETWAT